MFRATWRSLVAHRVRLLLSALSVVLGVAFVAGSLVFTDTLSATFNDLIKQTTADVVVTPKVAFTDSAGYGVVSGALPEAMVTAIRAVPGVAKVGGFLLVNGVTIIDRTGKPLGVVGAPNFGASWISDTSLTGLRLTQGRGPSADRGRNQLPERQERQHQGRRHRRTDDARADAASNGRGDLPVRDFGQPRWGDDHRVRNGHRPAATAQTRQVQQHLGHGRTRRDAGPTRGTREGCRTYRDGEDRDANG
jgi:hypothetical protein